MPGVTVIIIYPNLLIELHMDKMSNDLSKSSKRVLINAKHEVVLLPQKIMINVFQENPQKLDDFQTTFFICFSAFEKQMKKVV